MEPSGSTRQVFQKSICEYALHIKRDIIVTLIKLIKTQRVKINEEKHLRHESWNSFKEENSKWIKTRNEKFRNLNSNISVNFHQEIEKMEERVSGSEDKNRRNRYLD